MSFCLNSLISNELFGRELSIKVAEKLMIKKSLANVHRGYCGIGFFYNYPPPYWFPREPLIPNHFYVSCVEDGDPLIDYKKFSEKEKFINWLAEQSDYTMCYFPFQPGQGDYKTGNQKINYKRLINFIERD